MKDLTRYNVCELNSSELIKANGGFLWPVAAILIAMLNDAQNNPDDYWAGYNSI